MKGDVRDGGEVRPWRPWGIALGFALVVCGGCAIHPYGSEVVLDVERHGARAAVAAQVVLGFEARAQGRWEEVARRLVSVWPWTTRLTDRRVVRELLGSVPEAFVPRRMRAEWRVVQAWSAFESTGASRAAVHLAALADPEASRSLDALSRARAWLLEGLVAGRVDGVSARERLHQAAVAAPGGPVGRGIEGVAWLAAASIAQERGRYGEAMEDLLRVPRDSGVYRDARHALAWCQYHRDRPERAYKILALLPGGTPGSPDRAVLAAMAAHAMGHLNAAQEIVAVALEGEAAWRAAAVDTAEVLTRLAGSGGEGPRDRAPESMLESVADHRAVRGLGLELLATRRDRLAQPDHLGLRLWEDELSRLFQERVVSVAAEIEALATAGAENLRLLAPQLVAP